MRAWPWVLVLALALGAALRLHGLGDSLRVDELEAWAHAQKPMSQILADESRLPHVSVLTRLSGAVLGDGESALRLPYALYGLLSLPLLFLLGRRLFGSDVGALACLLLSLSPYHVQYSQDARYYAPLMFYALAALQCMAAALAAGSWGLRAACWAGFALAHALALYLHRFALYPLALCAVFLLAAGLDSLRRQKRLGAGTAAGLAVLTVSALLLAPQWAGLKTFLLLENLPGRSLPLKESYLLWHYRPKDANILWDLLRDFSGGEALSWLFLASAAAGVLAAGRERAARSASLGLWIILPVLSLFVVRSRTHFELRYFIFLLPVWLLLAAAGMAEGAAALARWFPAHPERMRRIALALGAAVVIWLDGGALLELRRNPKARFREAFAHIASRSRPGDAVVAYPAWDIAWYGYYSFPEGRRLFLPEAFMRGGPRSAAPRYERVWLAATWVADPARAGELAELRKSLERHYRVTQDAVFRSRDPNDDHHVWLFERRPGAAAAAPRDGGRPAWPAPDFRRDPFVNRKIRLALNLDEAAAALEASGSGFSRVLDNAAIVRAPVGKDWSRAVRFCRGGCIAMVWSGTGSLETGRSRAAFGPGDVFHVPAPDAAGLTLRGAAGTLLALFSPPDGAPGAAAFRSAGEGFRRIARLGTVSRAEVPGSPVGESTLWTGGAEVSSLRLRPGASAVDVRSRAEAWQRVTGVVWEGPVHIEDGQGSHPMDLRRGDLYLYCRVPANRWSASNRTGADTLELRFVEDRVRDWTVHAVTSATGKTGGLLPPMLLP